jgi:sigma-B regulation protein RsbU (phosphoserine phosphatase)
MDAGVDFFDPDPRNWHARLHITVDLMRELSHTADPEVMFQVFSRRMQQLFPTSRRISLSRRGLARPEVRVTRFSLWKDAVNPWENPELLPVIDRGIFSELIYADEPVIIDELSLTPDDPAHEYLDGQRSLMAIPNYDDGEAMNMVVVTREETHAFARERFADIVWMSNMFGRAAYASLLRQRLERTLEAADHEMQTIGRMQKAILPARLPEIPTLDLAVHYQPSRESGGDYYDFFPLPKGRWGILIADVSGHGTSAAVLMAITHSLARTYSGSHSPPGLLLSYLNQHLAENYTKPFGSFVTAFYAVYDPDRGTLSYASAGHTPARLIRCSDQSRHTLEGAKRLPLGISEWTDYPEEVQQIIPGDQVIFYTDGITEAANREGEHFGADRLDAVLSRCPVGARTLVDSVLDELDRFTGGQKQGDDRTLLAAKFTAERFPRREISEPEESEELAQVG